MSPFLCHQELFSLCWSCFLSPACVILQWLSELQFWQLSSVFKNFIILKLRLINERSQAVMQFSHADRHMCSLMFCHTLLWCSFSKYLYFLSPHHIEGVSGIAAELWSLQEEGGNNEVNISPSFFLWIFLELQTAAGHELIPSAVWMITGGNKHVWGWALCAWRVCLS